MKTTRQLTALTEEQIVTAMRHYSYGEGLERTLPRLINTLAYGVLQKTAGYGVGGTLHQSLRDLGLITVNRGTVTKKGGNFLYDCFNGVSAAYSTATVSANHESAP